MKRILILMVTLILLMTFPVGCSSFDDTVETCVVANEQYGDKASLEAAKQPDNLYADKMVYTNLYVIESPRGMEYTVKWYLNDTEIKAETKATQNDMHDNLVFRLEAPKVTPGNLKVEIVYQETVLMTKEIPVK